MRQNTIRRLAALAVVLTSAAAAPMHAQEAADRAACAQLLPAIESLKAMLAQDSKARAAADDTQRMQIVTALLGVRYHKLETLESSLRGIDAEEDDVRGALGRARTQLDALDEAARNSATGAPDPERKAARAEVEANTRGLEERLKSLAERKSSYQGQLAVERHDIDKLEALVRAWLERAQP